MSAPGGGPWILWLLVPAAALVALHISGRRDPSLTRLAPQLHGARAALESLVAGLAVVGAALPAALLPLGWGLAWACIVWAPLLGLAWSHALSLRDDAHPWLAHAAEAQASAAREARHWWGLLGLGAGAGLAGLTALVLASPWPALLAVPLGLLAGVGTGRALGTFVFLGPPRAPARRTSSRRRARGPPIHLVGLVGLASVTLSLVFLVLFDRPGEMVAAVLALHAAVGFVGTWAYAGLWRRPLRSAGSWRRSRPRWSRS